jgi:hypothetical protein
VLSNERPLATAIRIMLSQEKEEDEEEEEADQ